MLPVEILQSQAAYFPAPEAVDGTQHQHWPAADIGRGSQDRQRRPRHVDDRPLRRNAGGDSPCYQSRSSGGPGGTPAGSQAGHKGTDYAQEDWPVTI